jgi:hypothetical protein
MPKALRLFTTDAVVLDGDFERAFDGFRAGAGEEDAVEAGGQHLGELMRQAEGGGDAVLEGWSVVELGHLLGDSIADFAAAMAKRDAVQAGGAIQQFFALGIKIIDAFGPRDEPGRFLEMPVCGEWHPLMD